MKTGAIPQNTSWKGRTYLETLKWKVPLINTYFDQCEIRLLPDESSGRGKNFEKKNSVSKVAYLIYKNAGNFK